MHPRKIGGDGALIVISMLVMCICEYDIVI